MGAAGYAIDQVTDKLVEAAGFMLIPAEIFPPTTMINFLMPVGKGGPGTVAEGARAWLDGSQSLGQARNELVATAAGLSADDWSGDDRDLYDTRVRELGEQLDIATNYANGVGAVLGGLAVALAPYGGVCIGIGGVLLSEALFVEAMYASVVGAAGPAEAAHAAGVATAATCLSVLTGVVVAYAALMEGAALGLVIGTGVEVNNQSEHGDESAKANFKKAEVDAIGEVAENLEGFAAGVAGDAVAGKVGGGLPSVTAEQKIIQHAIEGELGSRLGDVNSAGVDAVKGDPLGVLKDLSGYGDEIDAVESLFDDGPDVPADTVHYDLPPVAPPPPPIVPIPPAGPDDPNIVPVPNADPDDLQVIPAGTDINGDNEEQPA